jgi:hypothetical protein
VGTCDPRRPQRQAHDFYALGPRPQGVEGPPVRRVGVFGPYLAWPPARPRTFFGRLRLWLNNQRLKLKKRFSNKIGPFYYV